MLVVGLDGKWPKTKFLGGQSLAFQKIKIH